VSSQHTSPCKEDITEQERKTKLKTNALFAIRYYYTLLHLVTEESHEMGCCLFIYLFFGGVLPATRERERGTFGEILEKRNLAEAPLLLQPKGFSSAKSRRGCKGLRDELIKPMGFLDSDI